jgi:hypothetical protein
MAYEAGPTSAESGNSFTAELSPDIAAKYYTANAAINLSVAQAQARAKFAKENANANFEYGRGNLLRTEPLRLKANMSSANSQGLAESGQLAKAQTQTQGEYSQKQTGLAMQRAQAIKNATLTQAEKEGEGTIGRLGAYTTAKSEQAQYIAEHPTSTPNGVAPSPTTNLPPGYTATTQKGGSVSISPSVSSGFNPWAKPAPAGTWRKLASKKAVG